MAGKTVKGSSFIPTEQGSATHANLDGEGITARYDQGSMDNSQGFRGAPWSREPSLKSMCDEVNVDMDQLIAGIEKDVSDMEMGQELGVSPKTVKGLKNHFMTHGLSSIEGQD